MNLFGVLTTRVLAMMRLLTLAALAACLRPNLSETSSTIEPPPLMLNAHHGGEFFLAFEGDRARFSLRADVAAEPSITIVSLARSDEKYFKSAVSYPLRCWPTCVRAGEDGELWVAGKSTRTGNTVVEKWRFGPPALRESASASEDPLIDGPLLDVTSIYDAAAPGRSLVENMTPRLGSGGGLLVKFHDTKDVCTLLPDGSVKLVASSTAKPDTFHCPLLSRPGTVFSRRLAAGGFVYGWRVFFRVPDDQPSITVLHDADMDGVIERAEEISGRRYDELGWGDPRTWTPR